MKFVEPKVEYWQQPSGKISIKIWKNSRRWRLCSSKTYSSYD